LLFAVSVSIIRLKVKIKVTNENNQSDPLLNPLNGAQPDLSFDQKSSKWRPFFIVLGILQAAGVTLFILATVGASQLSKAGVSGMEFIVMILLATLVPAVVIVALINLVGLPIYMAKHKPQGKALAFSIVSVVISALLVVYGAYNVYHLYAAPSNLAEQSREKTRLLTEQFNTGQTLSEIPKEEAVELLKTCKLKEFYYTKQTGKADQVNGGWGELSSTGVVLIMVDGAPQGISIADKLITELVSEARNAQKTCAGPQLWHDGAYEQYKDGAWYFKGEAVTAVIPSGTTREEAIRFMQTCKVDYLVGYTGDINLAKDANTQSWLQQAEQSDTGIVISEDAPKTYVFVSKTQTAELQDSVRQIRQACYGQKKLYIVIDDWIETEYPAGKWTRVKQ
jgi:hypothetical protein